MAFSIGELVGYVRIDSTGVKSGMQDAEHQVKAGMVRTGAAAEKGGKETGSRFSKGVTGATSVGLKTLAAGVVAGFAIDRVVSFLGDATQAASDLQQTAMKSNVIFGSQAKSIDAWASKAADSFGLSKSAALDAAAGFGNMLQQLGDTQEQAAKTSTSVVQMAADLGSFNNLPTGDVLDRISAALRGEYDSLQLLIPNINAARVEQEAMAETGKKNASSLTAQEKAHATLAIIQKDGAKAQGDFARSAGTFAIEQQKAAAKSEELSAKIGEQLLPLMTTFQQVMSDQVLPAVSGVVDIIVKFAGAIGSIPGPITVAVTALAAIALLKGPVGSALETIGLKALYAGDALTKGGLKAGLSSLIGLLSNPWTIALAGATTALVLWQRQAEQTDAIADQLANTLDKATGAFTTQSQQSIVKSLLGDLSASDVQLLEKLGVNFGQAADLAIKGGAAFDQFRSHLVDMMNSQYQANGLFSDEGKALEGLIASLNRSHDAAEKTRIEHEIVAKVMGATADATNKTTDATKANTQATQDAAEAAKALATEQAHAAAGMDAHNQALQTIRGSLAEVGDVTDELNQKVQDKAQAEADATKSTKDGWQDYADGVKLSAKDVIKTLDEQTKAAENWRKNLLTVQKQGDEQFTAWVSQQPAQVAQAYASGTAAQKQKIYDAYKRNVGAQQALGIADGLAAGEHTVTDAAGNIYTATKDKLTGQTILIPVGVKAPSATLLRTVASNILRAIGTIHVPVTVSGPTQYKPRIDTSRRFGGPVGPIPGYAGGTLVGPGTGTSDSILAFVRETGRAMSLSNGEFVSTDSSRRRNQAALEAGNKGAMLEVAGTGNGSPFVQNNTFNMHQSTTPKEVVAELGWEARRA